MSQEDIGYKFDKGKWQAYDTEKAVWVPVGPETAAVLKGFTDVKDDGQGGAIFYTKDGQSLSEEGLLSTIESMDEAARLKDAPWWGPKVTAAFGPYYPHHPHIDQALNYAQDLHLPGVPGVPVPNKGIYQTIQEADAAAAANPGWHSVGNANGTYTLELDAPAKAATPEQPGYPFAPGVVTANAPAQAATPFSDRLTSAQALGAIQGFVGNDATPQEVQRWRDALMSGPNQEPTRFQDTLPPGYDANGRQDTGFHDVGGNPIANPFQAQMDARANLPFPGSSTDTSGANANPQAVVANLFTEAARRASYQGITPEQYDPEYATASPDVQAQIRESLAKKQIGGTQRFGQPAPGEGQPQTVPFSSGPMTTSSYDISPTFNTTFNPGKAAASSQTFDTTLTTPAGPLAPDTLPTYHQWGWGTKPEGWMPTPEAPTQANQPKGWGPLGSQAGAPWGFVGNRSATTPFADALAQLNQRRTQRQLLGTRAPRTVYA